MMIFATFKKQIVHTCLTLVVLFFFNYAYFAQITISGSVGVNGTYTSLTKASGAFAALNGTAQTGATITISITSDVTTEDGANNLNSGAWTSITINPSGARTISGTVAAKPLINLNGADYVTIDGLNTGGNSLIISNLSTASSAGTSTIRFINGATYNSVKNSTVKGATTSTSDGTLNFATSASTGNSNNLIDHCNITNAGSRPLYSVYSIGSSGYINANNTISNNNLYDCFNSTIAAGAVIWIKDYNSGWLIDANSIYETATYNPSTYVFSYPIYINATTANGMTVSNNYIGGTAALCGGTPMTKSNTATISGFYGMFICPGTTSTSYVTGNTIANIAWTSSNTSNGGYPFNAIYVPSGTVNITGNTIGSGTGNNSIVFTCSSAYTSIFYGIQQSSTGDISNNTIGSIKVAQASTLGINFYGIRTWGATVGNITNNLIGSTSTSSSINLNSVSSSNAQSFYGIYSVSTSSTSIYGNTIANITNANTFTSGNTFGIITATQAANYSIYNNSIHDITTASTNTNITTTPSIAGIFFDNTKAGNIYGNSIYNISNSSNAVVGVFGIDYAKSNVTTTAANIYGNYISGISLTNATPSTTARTVALLIENNSASATYIDNIYNNIIYLTSTKNHISAGIYEEGAVAHTFNFYHNTIDISATNTVASYALYIAEATSSRVIKNNIFYNTRTGTPYSMYIATSGGTITCNYNDYYPSTANTGYYGSAKTPPNIVTANDANSLSTDPIFNGTISAAYDFYPAATSFTAPATGAVTNDYTGCARPTTPRIGALEGPGWIGVTSTDFATASNWRPATVPSSGDNIFFFSAPLNNCLLDSDRTVGDINNAQSTYNMVTNGHQLTINGALNFTNSAYINGSATSSTVAFAGGSAQTIPSGSFSSNSLYNLTINNSSGVTLNSNLTTTNNLTLTAGTFATGTNTVTVSGNILGTSTATSSSGKIYMNGNAGSAGISGVTLTNLELNSANDFALTGSPTVNGTLTLTNGKLTLGTYNLTIGNNGSITGQSSSSYLITNSTGVLTQNNIGTAGRTGGIVFPLGISSSSYTPVTINNTGTADNFSIYVALHALDNGATGTAFASNYLDRTWFVSEATPGGSSVIMTPQWNTVDELSGFDHTLCSVTHYTSAWHKTAIGATASGSNPYTIPSGTVTSFSPFSVTSIIALSIELLSFSTDCDETEVKLRWKTAAEQNNAYFAIERSNDGIHFDEIDQVPGAGNSNNVIEYSYIDKNNSDNNENNSTNTYYRLKQVDIDGKSTYLGIESAGCKTPLGQMTIFPNPANESFICEINNTNKIIKKIQMSDMTGRVIFTQEIDVQHGMNQFSLSISDLESGMYQVVLLSPTEEVVFSSKLVKK